MVILTFGDKEKKIHLFNLLAQIHNRQGLHEEASWHVKAIIMIRRNNGWKIDNRLLEQINVTETDLHNITVDFVKLKEYWSEIKYKNREILTGKVMKILPNGKAGFIECKDNNSYYFRFSSFKGKKSVINPGLVVSFYTEESFDNKKQQVTTAAINIKPLIN